MTQLGTFWEGLIVIVLGIVMQAAGKYLGTDYSATSALLIGIGIGYIKGPGPSNGTTTLPKS